MDCPIETATAKLLDDSGIRYTRPTYERDGIGLDFYLPDHGLYIEVKQFHSDRIAKQLSYVPERSTAIVLMGPKSVQDFAKLCLLLAVGK